MFHSANNPRIGGGNFSIVRGAQTNNYYLQSQAVVQSCEVPPGEAWKTMLYQEYERIPLGRIKLLKTLCEIPALERRFDKTSDSRKRGIEAKRTVELSCIIDGREECRPLLTVKYTGRDAKEIFREDCMQFSRQRFVYQSEPLDFQSFIHAEQSYQLRAFNDSMIPIIIFHEELVSARQFLEHSVHSIHAQCYLRFQTRLNLPVTGPASLNDLVSWVLSASEEHDLSNLLWIRPHTGDICFGPAGPSLASGATSHLTRFQLMHGSYPYYRKAPPLPLNACSNASFLDYLIQNAPDEFVLSILPGTLR
ncbi:hypothetical protein PQX77_006539, partial [Marasmius sp. AFHP31]